MSGNGEFVGVREKAVGGKGKIDYFDSAIFGFLRSIRLLSLFCDFSEKRGVCVCVCACMQ